MKLGYEQIKSITKGASRIISSNGKINFLRFTEEQEAFYATVSANFLSKTFDTAGVRLEFITDSTSLSMKIDVIDHGSSRTFFNHDICVNGELRYSLGADLADSSEGHMALEGSYALGIGRKKVCIYFPWSVRSELISLDLDNGASVEPVTHARKILMFGDSITHGYDTLNPSLSYSSRLTDALDAEGCNKGIGGDVFRPELATLAEDYQPDIVTVAYGTNDWSNHSKELFDLSCESFYKNLSELYPNAKIFALSPIWRGNYDVKKTVGEFSYLAKKIGKVADSLPNVTMIDCIDFIPHKTEMFSPDVLHPNSDGFGYYAEGLVREINKYL